MPILDRLVKSGQITLEEAYDIISLGDKEPIVFPYKPNYTPPYNREGTSALPFWWQQIGGSPTVTKSNDALDSLIRVAVEKSKNKARKNGSDGK